MSLSIIVKGNEEGRTCSKSTRYSAPAYPHALLVACELELLSCSCGERQFGVVHVGCPSSLSFMLSGTPWHIIVICWQTNCSADSTRSASSSIRLRLYRARSPPKWEWHLSRLRRLRELAGCVFHLQLAILYIHELSYYVGCCMLLEDSCGSQASEGHISTRLMKGSVRVQQLSTARSTRPLPAKRNLFNT
jgi:hypothetical protein